MLKILKNDWYRVKKGDTLLSVAREFGLPECLLASLNSLTEEVRAGQILLLPERRYHLYTVRGGDSKKKLCGSGEKYGEINGTDYFFVGMKIFIPV